MVEITEAQMRAWITSVHGVDDGEWLAGDVAHLRRPEGGGWEGLIIACKSTVQAPLGVGGHEFASVAETIRLLEGACEVGPHELPKVYPGINPDYSPLTAIPKIHSEDQPAVADAMAEAFVMYIGGEVPWSANETRAFGPVGPVGPAMEEDMKQRRRMGVYELLNGIDLEKLLKASLCILLSLIPGSQLILTWKLRVSGKPETSGMDEWV
ncbi:hypothetical protein FPV67DRAFT_1461864 [Lyophyllum atratum]|nr:hypothetical protein FPV67DRAFT_1461864 [Lyophyllum atratum]